MNPVALRANSSPWLARLHIGIVWMPDQYEHVLRDLDYCGRCAGECSCAHICKRIARIVFTADLDLSRRAPGGSATGDVGHGRNALEFELKPCPIAGLAPTDRCAGAFRSPPETADEAFKRLVEAAS